MIPDERKAEAQRVLRHSHNLPSWREFTRGWTLAEFEYAAGRHADHPTFSCHGFNGDWIELSRSELIAQNQAQTLVREMGGLKEELISTRDAVRGVKDGLKPHWTAKWGFLVSVVAALAAIAGAILAWWATRS